MARNTKAATDWRVAALLIAVPVALLATFAAVGLRRLSRPVETDVSEKALEEVLEDEWMVVQMAGQPAGRARRLVRRKGDRVLTNSKVVISVRRLVAPISISVSQSSLETTDGRPIRFKMVQDAAVQKAEVTARLEDGKLKLTSVVMGQERTKTIDWPEGVLVGHSLEEHVRERARGLGDEVGAKFSFRTFSLEHDGFLDVTYELAGEETIDVLGERVRTRKFSVTGIAPGITVTEYRDEEGIVWKQEMGLAGMDIAMLRASKQLAEAETKGPASIDAIRQIAVDLDTRIERHSEVDLARYRLRLTGGRATDLSLDGPRQSVEKIDDDGSVILRVESVRAGPGSAPAFPVDAGAVERHRLSGYLQPTTYLQSDDPALARKAREVVRGLSQETETGNSYEAAKLLERWVFGNITRKGFDRGFASAKEVFEDRAGDCTEHAVLLAAMLRAVGIPSRVATGVTYMELAPGRPRMFYHMWTEGWLGRWVPLDATLAGEFVDACHLRLAASDMSAMSPEAGFLEMLQAIGRLQVEVLEYRLDGRVVRP